MKITGNQWRDIAIGSLIGMLSTTLGIWTWIYSILGGSYITFLIINVICVISSVIGGHKIKKWWGALVGIAVGFIFVHLLILGFLFFNQS